MSASIQLSRRTLLRGLGTAVALPMLDAMLPRAASAAGLATGGKAPLRAAWFYVPNGVHLPDWVPTTVGADYELPRTLDLLKDFRRELAGALGNDAKRRATAGRRPRRSCPRAGRAFSPAAIRARRADRILGSASRPTRWPPSRSAGTRGSPSLELGCEAGHASRHVRQRLFLRLFVEHGLADRLDSGRQGGQSPARLRAALRRRPRQRVGSGAGPPRPRAKKHLGFRPRRRRPACNANWATTIAASSTNISAASVSWSSGSRSVETAPPPRPTCRGPTAFRTTSPSTSG